MKTRIIILFTAISALTWSCSHSHEEHGHTEAETHEHAPGVIVLHEDAAARFGVKTDTIVPGPFHAVVKAAGQVTQSSGDDAIASTPTAGILRYAPGIEPGKTVTRGALIATIDASGISGGDANAAAKAALESAQAELARVEDLYTERLATQGELLAAQAEVAKAKAAFSPAAASGRVTAAITGTITALTAKEGEYVGDGSPIASLGKSDGSVLRVDLPRRYYSRAAEFTDLTADFPAGTTFTVSDRGGRRTGSATSSANAAGGYIPVYFTASGVGQPAGTPFTAYLIGSEREGVITVPVSALSEQQGTFFVYLHTGGEHFAKQPVTIGESDGLRAEITGGLEPGSVVVTEGVSAVRLAETSAVAPQGHTHNH